MYFDARKKSAGDPGTPVEVAADGADADEIGVVGRGRAPARDGVVGIVADVGVDPNSHRSYRRRTASSAGSSTG
jgi:hypothetical protein